MTPDVAASASVLASCTACGAEIVFDGRWACSACGLVHGSQAWGRRLEAAGWRVDAASVLAQGAAYMAAPGIPAAALAAAPLFGAAVGRGPIFSSSEADMCRSSPTDTRKRYLQQVDALTSGPRAAMAAKLRLRSGRVAIARHWSGDDATRSKWHEQRIEGVARRLARVEGCGAPLGVFHGKERSGAVHERALRNRCGDHVLCPKCLEIRRARMREGMERVLPQAREARKLQRSRFYRGPEGRWSERLLTLTVPHSGVPADDARAIRTAWRRWTQLVWDHLRKDRGCRRPPVWVRVLEIAGQQGAEGAHVHLHVWWLGPYIEHTVARHYWGQALQEHGTAGVPALARAEALGKAIDARTAQWLVTRRGPHGRPLQSVLWPHVHVEAARDDFGAKYATKMGLQLYLTKGSDVLRMHPLHAAACWHAMRSVRVLAWSRGWAPSRRREWLFHFIRRHTAAELAALRAEPGDGKPENMPPEKEKKPPSQA